MDKKIIINALFFILDNLRNKDIWGGKHTSINNLTKGMPSWITQTNQGKKAINHAIKIGLKNQFLFMKKSTEELHFSLNPHQSKRIFEFINKAEKLMKGQNILKEICEDLDL